VQDIGMGKDIDFTARTVDLWCLHKTIICLKV